MGFGGGGGKNSFFFADLEVRYLDSWGVRWGRASGMRTLERRVEVAVDLLLDGAGGGRMEGSSSGKASRITRERWACSRIRGMGGGCGVVVSGCWICGYMSNGVGCDGVSAGCTEGA